MYPPEYLRKNALITCDTRNIAAELSDAKSLNRFLHYAKYVKTDPYMGKETY